MPPLFTVFLCVLLFAASAIGAEPDRTSDVQAWEKLLAQKKELSSMSPPALEGPEFKKFLTEYSRRAGELADAFKAFHDKNPNNREGRDAWRQWLNYLDAAAQGSPERALERDKTEQKLLAHPNLSRNQRESIRWNQVDRIRDLAERERFVRSIKGEFKADSAFVPYQLLNIAEFTDPEHARQLVEEVLQLTGTAREHAHQRQEALKLREKLDRIGQPLELKFTALDGAPIDLEDFSGKVVLIDFWATWCSPCIVGIPKVRALWEKHRPEGFEVICISYDTDREKLEKFIQKNSMPWPQFFSPEGNDAPLVTAFGKPGPPAYWLVDRNGLLADVSGWNDLEGKVKRLLTQKAQGSN